MTTSLSSRFETLPDEILRSVIDQGLTYRDIINLCQTNKFFYRRCQQPQFWQNLLAFRYPHYRVDVNAADLNYQELYRQAELDYVVFINRNGEPIYEKLSSYPELVEGAALSVVILNRLVGNTYPYRLIAYNPNGQRLSERHLVDDAQKHLLHKRLRLKHLIRLIETGNKVYRLRLTHLDETYYFHHLDRIHLGVIDSVLRAIEGLAVIIESASFDIDGYVNWEQVKF